MDDDEEILKATGNLLNSFGFDVSLVKDGEEAIEFFRKERNSGNKFDVVIMDLTIPGGLGGKDTIKVLKEIDPDVKAIVSSGYSNDPIMSNFCAYGFNGVVAKPYNLEQLIQTINKVIDE